MLLRTLSSEQHDSYGLEHLSSTSLPAASPSATRKHRGRTVITRTPIELVAEINGKTSLEVKEISGHYEGFALETDGVMADIDERYDGVVVLLRHHLPDESECVFIHLLFDKKLLPELRARLKVGARVCAVGIIDSVDTYGLSMRDCDLQAVNLLQPTP